MRVAGPTPTPILSQPATTGGARALTPGQVLHALVVGSPTANAVLLRVGELELVARTELPLSRGQALVLEVTRGGDIPELRVVGEPSERDLVAQALRASLPRALPLGDVLDRLTATWRAVRDAGALPPAVSREVDRLVQGLRSAAPAPAALRQAAADSGLFLEARLAQGRFDPADMKGLLLRLLDRLPPKGAGARPAAPDEPRPDALRRGAELIGTLRDEAEAALATLRGRQLASLPDAGQPPAWHFELPLRDPSGRETTLWLRAERDADGRESAPRWSVTLRLDLEPLGPVHAQLSLHGERIAATLWAERPATATLLDRQLGLLVAGFERAGLAPLRVAAGAGRPPAPADRPGAVGQRTLLDEQA